MAPSIGANETGSAYIFEGNIDEVAVWDSVQNNSLIYNSGKPNNLSSLSPTVWYRNGDGDTYPTLTDNGSASRSDGTMINMESGDFVNDVP